MHIFVTILVLIVMLGILISAHEAGHLFVAKRFNVYCDEYSIGFGPKLFSHKRKGAETTFSIRAIPLGGYVSMYGEEAKKEGEENEDDRFKNIPVERSLEGISAWKRCLVLIAGITVNLLISFIFCLIYSLSFPIYQSYDGYIGKNINISESSLAYLNENKTSYTKKIGNDQCIYQIGVSDGHPWVYGFYLEGDENIVPSSDSYSLIGKGIIQSNDLQKYGYIIDTDALLNEESHVVVLYFPLSVKSNNDLYSCLSIYFPLQDTEMNYIESASDSLERAVGVNYYPDFGSKINLAAGDTLKFNISIANKNNTGNIVSTIENKTVTYTKTSESYEGPNLTTNSKEIWQPFGQRLLNGCMNWVNFFPMIGEGLKSLFVGNINSIGGVVAIGAGLSQLSSYMGWGKTFFYYGGLVSLNLAIFNLLPFPGLDGWGLLVTVIEKIFKKKIPQNVKSIVSFIGLALLMLLAVFITVKDVINLF